MKYLITILIVLGMCVSVSASTWLNPSDCFKIESSFGVKEYCNVDRIEITDGGTVVLHYNGGRSYAGGQLESPATIISPPYRFIDLKTLRDDFIHRDD